MVLGLAAGLAALGGTALYHSLDWYGRPVAGALVDPGCRISNVGSTNWDATEQGFKFPDRIVGVDGAVLPADQRLCAQQWDAAVAAAHTAGRETVDAVVARGDGTRTHASFRITALTPVIWWLFAVTTIAVGVLWSGAGLAALWFAPKSALARTTARVGVSVGMFMIGLFDLHANRALVPAFYAGLSMLPFAWIMLALRLPDDVAWMRRAPWLESVGDATASSLACGFVIRHVTGGSTLMLQMVTTSLVGLSLVAFASTFVMRFIRATGGRRRTLGALLWAMVPPHVLAGLLLLSGLGSWRFNDLLFYPALSLAPLATLYAFVRYDLWGSRALLSRVLTRLAVGSAVWLAATAIGALAALALGVELRAALASSAVSAAAAALLVGVALELSDRVLFPAMAAYKPTVTQLSADLTELTSPHEVAEAIERTVSRWLSCDRVAFVPCEPEPARSSGERRALAHGGAADGEPHSGIGGEPRAEHSHPTGDGGRTLGVSFAGRRLGDLLVGPKPGGALYTTEDDELLATIAEQGGLALAHAHAYQELERRRREQAQAWRAEREALVATVTSELAHEIRHPINFFRSVFRDGEGAALDSEDAEVGRAEVERLELLVAGLKRVSLRAVERRRVAVRELCERAERLLRDALGTQELAIDVPDTITVRCDPDRVIQMLVNLVSNALEACGPEGDLGVTWESGGRLVVWDSGPGFEGDAGKLFAPWYTTKASGTGLGLAITHRLATAHEWSVQAERGRGTTRFVIRIRPEDLARDESSGAARVA